MNERIIMANILNPLSNLSYINKDFQVIYPELLNVVKKLAYKWDPTISDESDPGVLLIKLNAIIADKCNYNIDKNVLECFPESVTQEKNARQLFSQLGYSMKWYRSGSSEVSIQYIGDNAESDLTFITLPIFTMLTDSEGSVVYTTTRAATISLTSATPTTVPVIEGTVENYTLPNSSKITVANLDSKNRLYFTEYNIAENGIFIANTLTDVSNQDLDYTDWRRVDNLAIQPLGEKVYSFGIDSDNSVCYIQFPEDAATLFGQGINIYYIKSAGINGNIARGVLEKFYQDTTVDDLSLTSDNIKISNLSRVVDGKDPETIDEAYLNYKKTVGVFDTLVTLRDYVNAIYSSEKVYNCQVTDRLNDIQDSYYITSLEGDSVKKVHKVNTYSNIPSMSAYNLKFYILQPNSNMATPVPTDAAQFSSTFNLIPNNSIQTDIIQKYIEQTKHVQHDILPISYDKIALIKLKYPLSCRIIPQYQLNQTQLDDLMSNVYKALYEALYSRVLDFGEEISYDYIYDTIQNADTRIKSIALDELKYTAYAQYIDTDDTLSIYDSGYEIIKEIPISDNYADSYPAAIYSNNRFIDNSGKIILAAPGSKYLVTSSDSDKFKVNDIVIYTSKNGWQIYSDKLNEFRDEIKIKCILNGNTPLLKSADNFLHTVQEQFINKLSSVHSISTKSTIQLKDSPDNAYTVRPNETIQITAPNFNTVSEYSYNVKFDGIINNAIKANKSHVLGAAEYIVFYWKENDTDTEYTYRKYGTGTRISPNFNLDKLTEKQAWVGSLANQGTLTPEQSAYVKSSFENILSGTNSISILENSKTVIEPINDVNATYNCYWFLNSEQNNSYVLVDFEKQDTEKEIYLDNDEYFVFTNSEKSNLSIFGPGTQIKITKLNKRLADTWAVEATSSDDLLTKGINEFDGEWKVISTQDYRIEFIEMSIINLNSDVDVYVSKNIEISDIRQEIDSDGFDINYKMHTADIWSKISDTDSFKSSDSWYIRSILNITTSAKVPQVIYAGQIIHINDADINISPISSDNPIYLLSSINLISVGGQDKDIGRLTTAGTIEYPDLYWFNRIDTPLLNSDNSTLISFGIDAAVRNMKLNSGRYVLPMQLSSLAPFKLSSTESNIRIFGSGEDFTNELTFTDASPKFTYFIDINADSEKQFSLTFISEQVSRSVALLPLFSYVDDSTLPSLLSQIKNSYDQESIYNVTYQPSEDELIENPLEPNSFLNIAHPYNKFTLSEFNPQLSLNDIKILNKVKQVI